MERKIRFRGRPVTATATPAADAAPSTPQSQAAIRAKGAYEVGYGKPPVHSRFKKGRSGNPRGRPKGARDLHALIERGLDGKIIVIEGGRRREVTRREALVMRMLDAAMKGDHKAQQALLKIDTEKARMVEVLARETAALAADDQDDATDRAILDAFRDNLRGEMQAARRGDNGNGTDNEGIEP